MLVTIKGVKFEIDERFAVMVDQLRVGDKVKVLKKTYDNYEVHPGVVIGFAAFKELPSIEILYVKKSYSNPEVCFDSFNEKSEIEIVKAPGDLPLETADVLAWFDREKTKKEMEIIDLSAKRSFFSRWFGATQLEAQPQQVKALEETAL